MRTTDDKRILEYFCFLTEQGFALERDYNKATDRYCTQIYRFARSEYDYLEYRVLTEKECTLCVCVRGEKRFPNLRLRYRGLVSRCKFLRIFRPELRDEWRIDALLLQEDYRRTGSYCGLTV